MKLTTDQLDEIESLAAIFYSIKEIALIMELPHVELMEEFRQEDSDVSKRYNKGFLTTDAEIRISEIGLAKRGSTPAQASAAKYKLAAKTDNF